MWLGVRIACIYVFFLFTLDPVSCCYYQIWTNCTWNEKGFCFVIFVGKLWILEAKHEFNIIWSQVKDKTMWKSLKWRLLRKKNQVNRSLKAQVMKKTSRTSWKFKIDVHDLKLHDLQLRESCIATRHLGVVQHSFLLKVLGFFAMHESCSKKDENAGTISPFTTFLQLEHPCTGCAS